MNDSDQGPSFRPTSLLNAIPQPPSASSLISPFCAPSTFHNRLICFNFRTPRTQPLYEVPPDPISPSQCHRCIIFHHSFLGPYAMVIHAACHHSISHDPSGVLPHASNHQYHMARPLRSIFPCHFLPYPATELIVTATVVFSHHTFPPKSILMHRRPAQAATTTALSRPCHSTDNVAPDTREIPHRPTIATIAHGSRFSSPDGPEGAL